MKKLAYIATNMLAKEQVNKEKEASEVVTKKNSILYFIFFLKKKIRNTIRNTNLFTLLQVVDDLDRAQTYHAFPCYTIQIIRHQIF
jgi:hypothetical protein